MRVLCPIPFACALVCEGTARCVNCFHAESTTVPAAPLAQLRGIIAQ